MEYFKRADVEAVVVLLADAGNPAAQFTMPERKRRLMEGTARLVDADMWYLGAAMVNPNLPGDAMPSTFLDGGWSNDEQRLKFFQFLSTPTISEHTQKRCFDVHRSQRHQTLCESEILPATEDPQNFLKLWRAAGIGDCLLSMHPVNQNILNCLGVYRRTGRPPFTERDRAIVHLIFQLVDWVHGEVADVPAGMLVLQLTPRERQVLILLLSGDSQKEVAQKLGLSMHTVGDYLKTIYRQLKVSSRSQLLAAFMTGGQRQLPD